MVLTSEGHTIKSVQSPPRDRRYALIAYARLASEYCTSMPQETVTKVVGALIELASPNTNAFNLASSLAKTGEELLMDGAVD